MSEKFTLEVISPDRTILKVNAIEVVIPSYEGEIGILKDHIPLITFLRPGLIKIIDETKKDISGVEVFNDKVIFSLYTIDDWQEAFELKNYSIEIIISEKINTILDSFSNTNNISPKILRALMAFKDAPKALSFADNLIRLFILLLPKFGL